MQLQQTLHTASFGSNATAAQSTNEMSALRLYDFDKILVSQSFTDAQHSFEISMLIALISCQLSTTLCCEPMPRWETVSSKIQQNQSITTTERRRPKHHL
jgi:hypothetical protein